MSIQIGWKGSALGSDLEHLPKTDQSAARRMMKAIKLAFKVLTLSLAMVGVFSIATALLRPTELQLVDYAGLASPFAGTTAKRDAGFITITGTASPSVSEQCEAVVELLNSKNQVVGLDSSLLSSGAASTPFRVDVQDDTAATSYRLRLRSLSGRWL